MNWQEYYEGEWANPSHESDYAAGAFRSFELGLFLQLAGDLGGVRVLDAGCGMGGVARTASHLGPNAVGVDYAKPAIDALSTTGDGHFFVGDLEDQDAWPFAGTFGLVVCTEALQCVRDPAAVIRGLWSKLDPGGRLICTMPNADCATNKPSTEGRPFSLATSTGLAAIASSLPGMRTFGLVGLAPKIDQRVVPFDMLDSFDPATDPAAAYRLVLVVERW